MRLLDSKTNELMSSESNSLLRIDKNIVQNGISFSQYGECENLARDLYIYFIKARQTKIDLFGDLLIDKKVFAKTMGIKSASYLDAMAEEPKQLKEKSKKSIETLRKTNPEAIYETRFDNTLYLMFSEPLLLLHAGNTAQGNPYLEYGKIDLIKSFKIIFDKKNRGKKWYAVSLGDGVLYNLSNYYTFIDTNVYVKLNNRLKSFYMLLCNIKYNLVYNPNKPFEYTFESLCASLKIESGEPKEKKRRINDSFKEISKIDPSFGIIFEWHKTASSRFSYSPKFSLDKNVVVPGTYIENTQIKYDVFQTEFLSELLQEFVKINYPNLILTEGAAVSEDFISRNEVVITHFKAWANNPEEGINIKKTVYVSAGKKTWGNAFIVKEFQITKFLSTIQVVD